MFNVETRVKQLQLNNDYNMFENTCSSYLKNNFAKMNTTNTT